MSTFIHTLTELFAYDFMRNAFLAGTMSAIISAIVGYFLVLRGQSFAGHALSHIGFPGAVGGSLIGLAPTTGQLLLTLLAAVGMSNLGTKSIKSDIAIGVILSFSLGLGILFLYFFNNHAGQAMTILFGNLLGISNELIKIMLIYSLLVLLGLGLIGRPLLFASLEPDLAEAKGISLRWISTLFLILVAITITEASQTVGILLIFTLLIGPAASALCYSTTFWSGIILSIIIGIAITWVGIIVSYFTNWPTSFWISTLSMLTYLIIRGSVALTINTRTA